MLVIVFAMPCTSVNTVKLSIVLLANISMLQLNSWVDQQTISISHQYQVLKAAIALLDLYDFKGHLFLFLIYCYRVVHAFNVIIMFCCFIFILLVSIGLTCMGRILVNNTKFNSEIFAEM